MEQVTDDDLFLQIRTAHRLLGAYYQRLLPALDHIVQELDCHFYVWKPSQFRRPGNLTTNPHERWAWDLLPGIATHYVYYDSESTQEIRKDNTLLAFHVVSDSAFLVAHHPESFKSEPDGLNMPVTVHEATSYVRVYVFAPSRDVDSNWYSAVWNDRDHPKYKNSDESNVITKVKLGVWGDFRVPLSELMDETSLESLVGRVKDLRDEVKLQVADFEKQDNPLTA